MVKKGDVILITEGSDSNKKYKIEERLDDFAHGEGGWKCIELNTNESNIWRISDRYLKAQIQRGVITIVN